MIPTLVGFFEMQQPFSESQTSCTSVVDFVAAVRAKRKELGLGQAELAGLAGLSIEGLSKIERGDAAPKLATVMKLLKLLGGHIEIHWHSTKTSSGERGR